MERIKQIQNLLLEAVEIKDRDQRSAFLANACGDDLPLRQEIEELIQAEAEAGETLPGEPAVEASRSALRRAVESLASSAASPIVTEKPGDRIGRYNLLQKIGEGGCGVVYVAEQQEPMRRQVALKIIKLGMDTRQVVARFEAERQALALMDHPNIAKVFDAGATEAGRPYFVMELVRGVRITDYCEKHNFGPRARLELFIQVCRTIQHAHQKGIIHRDIKPSNVLVTAEEGVAVPKVIDFGIAKATEGRLTGLTMTTAFEQFLGTPAYMSPEQAVLASADVDTRSDIYSLGVLLYELLTGMTPFDTKALLDAGLDELRRTIREKEPVRPSQRLDARITTLSRRAKSNGESNDKTSDNRSGSQRLAETKALVKVVRGDLDWIVMKCLEKDRSRRYETASGVAKDIERHLNNEPVLARPPSRLYEFRKTVRRHKVGFAATAAIMAALLAGVLVSAWQAAQKNHERQLLRANVVRQYVGNGARLVSDGDLFGSLLWYAAALQLDAGDPAREEPHRIRIAAVLRQCPRLLSVISHGTLLPHAEFSPAGNEVLTASDDHTARTWDANTGQPHLVLRHEGEVDDARYSKDGRRIITASRDGTAGIWDSKTGQLLLKLQHPANVWHARLSPDGALAATACMDNEARVWNVATGAPAFDPLTHRSLVQEVAFSPDGRLLATLSDGTEYFWDCRNGRLLFQAPHVVNWANDLEATFSPDGGAFVTYDDPKLHLWDAHTFQERDRAFSRTGVEDIAFSADGKQIVTAGDDGSAVVWDRATGQPRFSPPVQHAGTLTTARFSPEGRRFVAGGLDAVARLWSASTGQPTAPPVKTILHSRYVLFNPDGRRLLVKSCDMAARVWDTATSDPGPLCPALPESHRFTSPDHRLVLRKGASNAVWITDAATGSRLVALPHTNEVTFCCFSEDGRTVLTAAEDKSWGADEGNDVFLWDATTGRRLNTNRILQSFHLMYAVFSPDSRCFLTCGFDFCARLWDARTGEPLTGQLRHGQPVFWGAFSPDGASVVTLSRDRTARVWATATGTPLTPPLQHKSALVSAFWSADLKRLETVTADSFLQTWDLASGLPLTPPRKIRDNQNDSGAASSGSATSAARTSNASWRDEVLPRDVRPVEDLVLLSQMLSVGRIDAQGNAVPLTLPELTQSWETLRTKYPEQFAVRTAEAVGWHSQEARDSKSEGNLTAALFHSDRALALAPQDPALTQWKRDVVATLSRGTNEAISESYSRVFPARDPRADGRLIDLSSYYNGGLHKFDGKDFSGLPVGLVELAGVHFDVRGSVDLTGRIEKANGSKNPERINGIIIGRKCRRLHFLQATGYDAGVGEVVGHYVLHYAGGAAAELPMVFGQDLEDWWVQGLPSANLVWNGNNIQASVAGFSIGLYKSTRENPRPELEITNIDFVSNMTDATPFLVALTVE